MSESTKRAGSPRRTNDVWSSAVNEHAARTQADIVAAANMERDKTRVGLQVLRMGDGSDTTPASKIHKMSQQDLSQYLHQALRRRNTVKRIELYKDSRLEDDEHFDKHVHVEDTKLSRNVVTNMMQLSQKLSLTFSQKNVAGVDLNAEGDFSIFYWKDGDSTKTTTSALRRGKGATKEKVEVKDEVKEVEEVKPLIKISYFLT